MGSPLTTGPLLLSVGLFCFPALLAGHTAQRPVSKCSMLGGLSPLVPCSITVHLGETAEVECSGASNFSPASIVSSKGNFCLEPFEAPNDQCQLEGSWAGLLGARVEVVSGETLRISAPATNNRPNIFSRPVTAYGRCAASRGESSTLYFSLTFVPRPPDPSRFVVEQCLAQTASGGNQHVVCRRELMRGDRLQVLCDSLDVVEPPSLNRADGGYCKTPFDVGQRCPPEEVASWTELGTSVSPLEWSENNNNNNDNNNNNNDNINAFQIQTVPGIVSKGSDVYGRCTSRDHTSSLSLHLTISNNQRIVGPFPLTPQDSICHLPAGRSGAAAASAAAATCTAALEPGRTVLLNCNGLDVREPGSFGKMDGSACVAPLRSTGDNCEQLVAWKDTPGAVTDMGGIITITHLGYASSAAQHSDNNITTVFGRCATADSSSAMNFEVRFLERKTSTPPPTMFSRGAPSSLSLFPGAVLVALFFLSTQFV